MRALAILVAVVAAACAAAPSSRDVAPIAGAKRVTAIDMGLASSARRLDNLVERLRSLPNELLRINKLAKPTDLLDGPLRGVARIPDEALAMVGKDLGRRPQLPAGMLPTPDAYARGLADDLATTLELFSGAHHPLGEIDDRRHRTSPTDDHPEATWWQRIRRRLRL